MLQGKSICLLLFNFTCMITFVYAMHDIRSKSIMNYLSNIIYIIFPVFIVFFLSSW
ncbi:hypothetical protein C2G38_2078125 [Gigaspora rosea]|uniref:Uncharacterized protein n=1 Tax=Gigaspora rosea TaxID=44941 RepID=A0A397VI86_9GLOM|nr:hypothetical protein C2G38_2078125 [Gigaspora rosea]